MGRAEIVYQYVDAYNTFDVSLMLSALSENIVFIHLQDEAELVKVQGRDEFRRLAVNSAKLFSSRCLMITQIN